MNGQAVPHTRRSMLRWQGISTESPRARITIIMMLGIACVAMVATQLNYRVVGDAHMIVVLAPITACALLHGPLAATLIGAVTGLAELIHATLLPLDYYEKYFMAPINSVILFALVGLVMGLIFAAIYQHLSTSLWPRILALTGCCAFGSLLFTAIFHQSTYLINAGLSLELPSNLLRQLTGSHEIFSQWLADLGLMAPLTILGDQLTQRFGGRSTERTIRETFQWWLGVVMVVAYMTCAAFAYTGISVICRGDAEQKLSSQLSYLTKQLASRDDLVSDLAERTGASQDVIDAAHVESVKNIATGFALGWGSVSIVSEDGTIVSSNVDEYVGQPFEEVVGSGLMDGFDESLYDMTTSSEWDMGGGRLGFMRAAQIGYVRVARAGSYQLMVALSASEVYHYRRLLMAAVSAIFLAIFAILYAQASLLLQNVVVKGFRKTNATLARITNGDLGQVVDVHDSLEFTNLSGGINATVGALKDSLAETKARVERELSTAKAIQKSALPSTFPPFPDIDQFDIYASMDAAREVGGDFYDFFLIDDHTLGFLIADVSGKGIPAALFMMAAKTEVGNYMTSGVDLAQAVQSANYHLCQGNDAGMFLTMWAATLDWLTGELTYVNAGHNPPLLRHENHWEWLRKRGGLPMGVFDTGKYHSETIRLIPGDTLILYTDGVTEAFSMDEEQYGEERLERYLDAHEADHPHALVDGIRADVAAWAEGAEQSDDITLLSLEYGEAPDASGSLTVEASVDNLHLVFDFLHAELAKRLCPISIQNQIDIAVEELFVNVCHYAYADQDAPGSCRIDYVYHANPNSLTVQLTDHGVPFDPLQRKDPTMPSSVEDVPVGGLGILMAKRSVDDISYVYDEGNNVLVFRKIW